MTNVLTQAWPAYVAGLAVAVTSWSGAQIHKTLRRRRRRRPPAEAPQIPAQAAEEAQVPAEDRASE
ncbi:hypothetical protein [Streptomyces lydicus]|uniref:hypothetical protein n=1 Tax=Streptomyces lydicus TaxID=47763 RepID=UPI001010B7F7|nr:hypothetical protein [Streptomyces lydicus]